MRSNTVSILASGYFAYQAAAHPQFKAPGVTLNGPLGGVAANPTSYAASGVLGGLNVGPGTFGINLPTIGPPRPNQQPYPAPGGPLPTPAPKAPGLLGGLPQQQPKGLLGGVAPTQPQQQAQPGGFPALPPRPLLVRRQFPNPFAPPQPQQTIIVQGTPPPKPGLFGLPKPGNQPVVVQQQPKPGILGLPKFGQPQPQPVIVQQQPPPKTGLLGGFPKPGQQQPPPGQQGGFPRPGQQQPPPPGQQGGFPRPNFGQQQPPPPGQQGPQPGGLFGGLFGGGAGNQPPPPQYQQYPPPNRPFF